MSLILIGVRRGAGGRRKEDGVGDTGTAGGQEIHNLSRQEKCKRCEGEQDAERE